jgi:hypothetical protein
MELSINETTMLVTATDDTPLLWVLRDHLGMTGTKFGCGMGLCGASYPSTADWRSAHEGMRPPNAGESLSDSPACRSGFRLL